MAKTKTVNEFLDETVRVYGYAPLNDLRRREIRFKLGLADIKDVVKVEDTSLALDLVLAELQSNPVASGSMRTASASPGRMAPCPRCSAVMSGVKLSKSESAFHCPTCRVTVSTKG